MSDDAIKNGSKKQDPHARKASRKAINAVCAVGRVDGDPDKYRCTGNKQQGTQGNGVFIQR